MLSRIIRGVISRLGEGAKIFEDASVEGSMAA